MAGLLLASMALPYADANAKRQGGNDVPGIEIVPDELARTNAEQETTSGAYPGLVVTPRSTTASRDERYHQTYRAVCYGYRARQTLDERGKLQVTGWARRFAVHAPGREDLPFARQVTRLLLLIWNARHARRFPDHPGSEPVVEVWLTSAMGSGLSADIGGEQRGSQIYLYNIGQERSAVEWVREIAHEYGHYALPGVSGFTAPEEWANGVLGERLFLAWLRDDGRTGRFAPTDLPFISPEQLTAYTARTADPLVTQIARDGLNSRLLARRDAPGMDYYTALVLYLDSVYGSAMLLDALGYTQPGHDGAFVRPEDFLRGLQESLRAASDITLAPPFPDANARTMSLWCYLPQGNWRIEKVGGIESWQIAAGGTIKSEVRMEGQSGLRAAVSGWRKLTVTRAVPLTGGKMGNEGGKVETSGGTPSAKQARLFLHRRN